MRRPRLVLTSVSDRKLIKSVTTNTNRTNNAKPKTLTLIAALPAHSNQVCKDACFLPKSQRPKTGELDVVFLEEHLDVLVAIRGFRETHACTSSILRASDA